MFVSFNLVADLRKGFDWYMCAPYSAASPIVSQLNSLTI